MKSKQNRLTLARKGKGSPRHSPLWARLLLAFLSPIVFLVSIELVLILIGYGRAETFFLPWSNQGRTVYLSNHRYCEHFVPKRLSRTPAYSVLTPKTDKARRIFVFGGSAAYGDPEPAFGFCRQLEVLLNAVSQDMAYEVVNAAVTSMNSHVARRIALDCLEHDPDLFLVYMGNNEIVGPYGPPTLPISLYANRKVINALITAKQEFRLGQLLSDAMSAVTSSGQAKQEWLGMEAFLSTQMRSDDPKLAYCYRHFKDNMHDIVLAGQSCGIKTVLCTVPTNISDCPPFASLHDPDLTDEQLTTWETHFQSGRDQQQAGRFDDALLQYEKAAVLDGSYADLAYCRAQCLQTLDRLDDAEELYRRARDLDALRFRADREINSLIRAQASAWVDQGAVLFDLERELERALETSVLGEQALVDHVHLSVKGNFLAAHAALQVIMECFPDDPWIEKPDSRETLSERVMQQLLYDQQTSSRLATTMYYRKTRPPFVHQLDHERRMERLREALYRQRRLAQNTQVREEGLLASLTARPLDPYTHQRYGRFLVKRGRPQEAIDLFESFLKDRPFNITIRLELAYMHSRLGRKEQAVALLTSEATPYRYSKEKALLALAIDLVKHGRFVQAESFYEDCLTLDEDNIDALVNLAVIAGEKQAMTEAKMYLDRVLELDPTSVQAMINMGNYYVKTHRPEQAHTWFVRAVERDPYNHLAHIGLGIQAVRSGKVNEGVSHIIESVKLKPDFIEGYDVLERIYRQIGLDDKAKVCEELKQLFGE